MDRATGSAHTWAHVSSTEPDTAVPICAHLSPPTSTVRLLDHVKFFPSNRGGEQVQGHSQRVIAGRRKPTLLRQGLEATPRPPASRRTQRPPASLVPRGCTESLLRTVCRTSAPRPGWTRGGSVTGAASHLSRPMGGPPCGRAQEMTCPGGRDHNLAWPCSF